MSPRIPGRPIQHDPDFSMQRIIDNGGELQPDGTVERQELEADLGDTFTQSDAFPFNG